MNPPPPLLLPPLRLCPLFHLYSVFGKLTAGSGRTNSLCLEPDRMGFPSSAAEPLKESLSHRILDLDLRPLGAVALLIQQN